MSTSSSTNSSPTEWAMVMVKLPADEADAFLAIMLGKLGFDAEFIDDGTRVFRPDGAYGFVGPSEAANSREDDPRPAPSPSESDPPL